MAKITIFVIASLALIACIKAKGNEPASKDWESFKNFHNKKYASDTHESFHKANFHKNAKAIEAHNAAFKEGKVTYTKELNKFSDQDPKMFSQARNGFKLPENLKREIPTTPISPKFSKRAVTSFDWRNTGKISPVKDQGQCGSCWAFSAVGGLECQNLIATSTLKTYSEQELVSCDNTDNGCNGGIYTKAWNFLKNNGGIESEAVYSYTSGSGPNQGNSQSCKANPPTQAVLQVNSSQNVANNIPTIMQTLQNVGALSVAVDATEFQTYSSGVLKCTQSNLNHAVLLVGFGTGPTGDYWIVKNSWSTGWGEQGYIRISRNSTNSQDCGITKYVAYPTIKK